MGDYPQRFLCNIKGEDGEVSKEIEELNKENIRKWNNSRPIGGRADDIICLEYDLEYGDISESVPANKRYQSIQEMISTMYPKDRYGDTAEKWVNGIKKNNQKYIKALNDAIIN